MIKSDLVRRCTSTFRVAFPNPVWSMISPFAAGVLVLVLSAFGLTGANVERDSLYYLLSAQAQTLATVFVLALTLTLVSAQIASRYSQIMLYRILGGWVLWYAIPYGIGILLPLLLLNGSFFRWSVSLSLVLTMYCIFSLIPFTIAVRGLLSISDAMSEKTRRILAAGSFDDAREPLNDLGNIIVGALNLKDYESFQTGVSEQVKSALTSDSRFSLSQHICRQIRGVTLRYLDDRFASDILFRAILAIALQRDNGADALARGRMLSDLADTCRLIDISVLRDHEDKVRLIKEYAHAAIDENDVGAVRTCQMLLYVISGRTISELPTDSRIAHSSMRYLGDVTRSSMNSSLSDSRIVVMSAIARYEDLGLKAATARNTEAKDVAKNELRHIIANTSTDDQRMRDAAEHSLGIIDES